MTIPLAVGGVAALLNAGAMESCQVMKQPPLSPPAWLFPVAWTILYALMGAASYLVLCSEGAKEEIQQAISFYGIQLAINFLWPTIFFSFQWYLAAFLWLMLLVWTVIAMQLSYRKLSKTAAALNIPYLIWLSFAAYLNLGVWLLD